MVILLGWVCGYIGMDHSICLIEEIGFGVALLSGIMV